MLRAVSETAIMPPVNGSAYTYRLLQSVVRANPLLVGLAITTAASAGVLVVEVPAPTILSYCTYTQRLLAMLGMVMICSATAFRSAGTSIASALKAFIFSK